MADMSSSLKVVNIALVFCASFSLLAIFILILFIFTLCSLLVPTISVVGSAGGILSTGAAPAAGAFGGIGGGGGRAANGAAGRGGGGGGVVGIGAAAAAGAAGAAAGGGGGGGGAAAAGAGAAAAGAAAGLAPPGPSWILRSCTPGWTVLPSSTSSSVMTPEPGEGTGTEVLSVSISQRTSSSETLSPTAFSHLMSPSEMESAKAGHTITFTSSPRTLVVKILLLTTGFWYIREADGRTGEREAWVACEASTERCCPSRAWLSPLRMPLVPILPGPSMAVEAPAGRQWWLAP